MIFKTKTRNRTFIFPGAICQLFASCLNPYPANLNYLHFQPLEVVSRYRDPQPRVVENYSYLFNLTPNISTFWCLNSHFISDNSDLTG